MTAAPSLPTLLLRNPANRQNSVNHKPATPGVDPGRPATPRRGSRGLVVFCLTLLAALASAGIWLEAPPVTQNAVVLADAP